MIMYIYIYIVVLGNGQQEWECPPVIKHSNYKSTIYFDFYSVI